MKLLPLVLIPALLQDPPPEPKPAWRRTMAVMNHSSGVLPAGVQIAMKRPPVRGDIEVRYAGKRLATWVNGDQIWFRVAAAIKEYERDMDYEIRYGEISVPSRPADVFEFFDEPGEKPPDPKKWEIDSGLRVQPDVQGTAVTGWPPDRAELDPASMILRHAPGENFIVEAEIRWEILPKTALNFAMRVEVVDEGVTVTDAGQKWCATLIAGLAAEDIEGRENASRELIKLGRPAVPQLKVAARSKDPETRARAATAIEAIHEKDPPPMIGAGFSTDSKDPKNLLWQRQAGKAREEFESRLERTGSTLLTIKCLNGEVNVGWPRSIWREFSGKTGRIRFDFWGGTPGEFGAVWIKRVIVRRSEGRAEAILGAQEEVK